MSTPTAHEADKTAWRAFVRMHHPDVGGDPEVFAAGLAGFAPRRESPRADPRLEAPVVAVRSVTRHRLGRLGRRLGRRLARRPRVQ